MQIAGFAANNLFTFNAYIKLLVDYILGCIIGNTYKHLRLLDHF